MAAQQSVTITCDVEEQKAPYATQAICPGPGTDQLKEILDLLPPLSLKFGPWCAGGAVRRILEGSTINDGDLDLFFTSRAEWQKFDNILKNYEELHRSNSATTYLVKGIKVQVIKRRFYDSLSALLGDFDFSVCQVATDGVNIAHTLEAIPDIKERKLRIANYGRISNLTIIGRMIKYVNHGFIPESGLFKLIISSGLDMTAAHQMFEIERPAANYDHDAAVDQAMDAKIFDSDALRKAAERLGVTL